MKHKKPEIGQIKATQEKTRAAFFRSKYLYLNHYGNIITPEQEKSKPGNAARIAEFRAVCLLSAFLA